MICDMIKNISLYSSIISGISDIEEFLHSDHLKLENAVDFPIGHGGVFANTNTIVLQDESALFFESHKKYIDIHYILEGIEKIIYADISLLTPKTQYDKENDVVFYNEYSYGSSLILHPNMFAVFLPNHAHIPAVQNTS